MKEADAVILELPVGVALELAPVLLELVGEAVALGVAVAVTVTLAVEVRVPVPEFVPLAVESGVPVPEPEAGKVLDEGGSGVSVGVTNAVGNGVTNGLGVTVVVLLPGKTGIF